jgi:hypothetical protein
MSAHGVPASDDEHPLPNDTVGFMAGGAVKYATTEETVQSRNFDPMPIDACRQQDGASPYALSAIQFHAIARICD